MANRRTIFAALAAAALALTGCDKEDGRDPPALSQVTPPTTAPAPPPATTTSPSPKAPLTGTGTLRGTVKFSGRAPALKPTQHECHPGGGKLEFADESFIQGPAGELKNVIVYLKNPPAARRDPSPAPVVDQ